MRKMIGCLILLLLLAACATPAAEPVVPTQAVVETMLETPTDWPLAATVPRTPTPDPNRRVLELDPPEAGRVALDFTALMCSASWTNNGEALPCPGDPGDSGSGSVSRIESPEIRAGYEVELPGLLTIPAHDGFQGIFGRYPAFTVQYGDEFRAYLTCAAGDECDLSFSLEYYDPQGNYHSMRQGFGLDSLAEMAGESSPGVPIQLSLDSLAGLTVDFTLVVREHGELDGDHAIWIAPYIYRDPNYTPPTITPTLPSAAAPAPTNDGIPGVIAGWVDMSSAPPYLLSSYGDGEPSSPVVVVFFNLDDGTWWWIHSTLTHPAYQMTVPPGRYQVVAYAHGVGSVPYVTGGYTGSNPSCGQDLAVVTVGSNEHIEDIVIADWNWSCSGTAFRPPKPDAVPLP